MKNKKFLIFISIIFSCLFFCVSDIYAAGVYTNKLISVPLWEESKDMVISGQYAYVVEGNQSDTTAAYLEVFDISNPLNPVSVKLISETNFSGGAWGVFWGTALVDGDKLYVIWTNATKTLLNVYNISDRTNPTLLGSFNGIDPYVQSTIAIRGSYIYACTNHSITNHNLSIIDVSNPASISVNKKFVNIAGPVFVEGNYLYTENYDAVTTYLAIYNISNPADPVFVSRKAVGPSITGLTVSGDYAYIGTIQPSGVDNFYIFDINNKSNPVKVGSNSNLPGGTNRNLHNLSFDG